MCGRFVVISILEVIEKTFGVVSKIDDFSPKYNVSPGMKTPVIFDDDPDYLNECTFGYTPFWAKKRMFMINARSEGDFNKENSPDNISNLGIISKPSFKHAIRGQRCLIIADAFYEGPAKEKLSKPYLVYMRNKQRPFAFAGIWDEWKDPSFNESRRGFAIITTAPNELMQKIDHPRSPVILHPGQWRKWLNPRNHLNDILPMLKPYPAAKMNAYPVSNRLKNPRENDIDLLKPLGDPVLEEKTIELGKRHEGFYKWEIRGKNRMKP